MIFYNTVDMVNSTTLVKYIINVIVIEVLLELLIMQCFDPGE